MTVTHHEIQLVAITMYDGSVAVMQFIARAWDNGALIYAREATDDAIQAEIDRTAFDQPVASWRRVKPEDLPKDRTDRNAWRDNGKTIAVDPLVAELQRPVDPLDAQIAQLEARIEKLEATEQSRVSRST